MYFSICKQQIVYKISEKYVVSTLFHDYFNNMKFSSNTFLMSLENISGFYSKNDTQR
jgi:hypothetical protein